ncbi:MAG: YciI family protein [Solirubrobacteraceae bacterium]
MPQYLLLIYGDPADAPPPEEQEAQMAKWYEYTQALGESGAMLGGNALEPADTATTVRVRDDETLITDGPFAETKEILGGYYLIDVADLDAALAWAAKMPNIRHGSVEVRPIWEIPEAPPQ